MSAELCRLCVKHPAIPSSHVIPKFVFRAIKSDSPTGYFRNPNQPNRRVQDGDTCNLLCQLCEQRFSDAERKFANEVFHPFHNEDRNEFNYGPWLHYFMTSIAWRTLLLDLPGLDSDAANPRAPIAILRDTEQRMRSYLLGVQSLATGLRNHAFLFTSVDECSPDLAELSPNVVMRRSANDYTIIDRSSGAAAIIHNLAGFLCFFVVMGNPTDLWQNTKVSPSGGLLKQPQFVKSWLMNEWISNMRQWRAGFDQMSAKQDQEVLQDMQRKPLARGLRFRELDRGLLEE